MRVGDFGFDNILLDEKSYENLYENILIYDISYKIFMGAKKFRIRLHKKRGLTYSISHKFARVRIDSCKSLPIEKSLTFHYVTIIIKSVAHKNKNNYDYNICLEKGSYENKSKTKFFLNECLYIINAMFR